MWRYSSAGVMCRCINWLGFHYVVFVEMEIPTNDPKFLLNGSSAATKYIVLHTRKYFTSRPFLSDHGHYAKNRYQRPMCKISLVTLDIARIGALFYDNSHCSTEFSILKVYQGFWVIQLSIWEFTFIRLQVLSVCQRNSCNNRFCTCKTRTITRINSWINWAPAGSINLNLLWSV